MEVPAPIQCLHCQNPIQETDVKAELPCHGFLHTACFFPFTRAPGFNHIDECEECQVIFTEHHYDVDEDTIVNQQDPETTQRGQIRNLYETNEGFRKKAKDLVKQRTLQSKAESVLRRVIKQKKEDIRPQLLLLKAQLQGLLEGKREEVRDSPEYKDFLKAKRRYNMLETHLRTQYNCSARKLQRYLNDKPGFRRFSPGFRHYWRSYSLMNRPWRYQVPI